MFSGVRPSSAAASSNSPCTSNHGAAGDLSTAAPVLAAPYTHLQSRRDCVLQPRVARNELPWVMSACAPQLRRSCAINRNNAIPQSLRRELLIRGVGATSSSLRGVMPEVSQGSSLLATLGFIAESLWDSRSLASIKIRVRCRLTPRLPLLTLCA